MYNLNAIPKLPGCYIFRNRHGQIIYIGKSKCLYNRVRHYFSLPGVKDGGAKTPDGTTARKKYYDDYNKYAELAKEVNEIETVVTDTETNALILECKLIKTHMPRYNSQLKQSSPYPYIRVGLGGAYPVISVADSIADDGGKYFGSFYDKYDAQKTIELIGLIWRTPVCGRASAKPCLNYHIGKCCAPCGGLIGKDEYLARISEIEKCLGGDFKQTRRRLKKEMSACADALDFEKAMKIRDGLAGLDRLEIRQKRLYTDLKNKSVYLFLRAFYAPEFSLFFIKDGITLNRLDFLPAQPAALAGSSREPSCAVTGSLAQFPGGAINSFISGNRNEKAPVGDGAFLTQCLLEIGAAKLFIPVAEVASAAQTLRKLKKAYPEFAAFSSR